MLDVIVVEHHAHRGGSGRESPGSYAQRWQWSYEGPGSMPPSHRRRPKPFPSVTLDKKHSKKKRSR